MLFIEDDSIGIGGYLCLLTSLLKNIENTKQNGNIILMALLLETPECLMLDCNSDSNSEY